MKAWDFVCSRETENVKLIVPENQTFLLHPVTFRGPCKAKEIKFLVWEIKNSLLETCFFIYLFWLTLWIINRYWGESCHRFHQKHGRGSSRANGLRFPEFLGSKSKVVAKLMDEDGVGGTNLAGIIQAWFYSNQLLSIASSQKALQFNFLMLIISIFFLKKKTFNFLQEGCTSLAPTVSIINIHV